MPIGLHEIHVSVEPHHIALLRRFAFERNMKPILAAAYEGQHPNQLMISTWRRGTSEQIICQADAIARDMVEAGLTPIRTKVESLMNNEGCPDVPAPGCYWEYHIKVAADDEHLVIEIAKNHGAALSYSVFKPKNEPLLTLRSATLARKDMEHAKEALETDLIAAGLVIVGVQSEYTVYDTNQALDDEWIVSLS